MAYLFTSESVSEGHPDKIADQISDALLDAFLKDDPSSRCAIETLCTTGLVFVTGEVTSNTYVDVQSVVRKTVREIGYTDPALQFDADSCGVITAIHEQSPDIAQGVNITDDRDQGAGDQGIMFGYATNQTESLMPLEISLAHELVRELARIRKETSLMPYLRPDAKSQVTLEYEDDRRTIRRLHTVVVSTQHGEEVEVSKIKEDIREHLLPRVIPAEYLSDDFILHVNPTGRFVIGGPHGDTGLTGRKIIVDTYGGRAPHGGGAFSGKDPSKVDRSATYAARHVAKNIVGAGLAEEVVVQLAYAIGVAEPISIALNTFGTGVMPDARLAEIVNDREIFDLRPRAIIQQLDLLRPIYKPTAAYGHFGRDGFSWEALNRVADLKQAANVLA